ncbi:DUF547 domain-containing protein [Maribacter aestuarii]|uniref:DUF547 domain-containing protein n=1 Tax=Maribacter aestuarii TaxID=1130723 RepID=UPI00248BA663|nr:DUF547 domain-containing protein [Maribacter aestuarii]
MKKISFLSLLLLVFLTCENCVYGQTKNTSNIDFNELSEDFLKRIKMDKDTKEIQETLANTTIEELENKLDTDAKKLAFWVNIYNGFIQVILKDNPELYNDRGSFFKKEQIEIAGEMVSFAKIEHGIIRKSQWEYGLGMIRKWFPNKFERKLRVKERDYRIHFALNCGAKDCPPVAIYEWERLDEQFDKGTERYLESTTDYNSEKKEVAVTSLFNWFRGDFGCKSGVKDILKKYELIPTTKGIDLIYKNYDWTLDLDNFIEL